MQFGQLRRREFITLLGGAAAWPLTARAQQPALPVVGFLNGQTAAGFVHLTAAFRVGLDEGGFTEGRNVAIEYRWANGDSQRMRTLAEELIGLRVAVLVATGGAHLAAKSATASVPIVCSMGNDPIKLGLAESIKRPGGNLTGMCAVTADLEAKRLEMLHEAVPKDAEIGVLVDPNYIDLADQIQEVERTARALGRAVRIVHAGADNELDAAFAKLSELRVGGIVVTGSPFFNNRRDRLLALSAHFGGPVIYENREFTAAGGLMSYGTNLPDVYRQIGVYTGRVLKGEKPADLPILFPTRFDIAINLKTAKALGLEVPTSILLRANEVIE
jgi:putative tryptophan/tyrosine transport system substrate-binding protein